MTAMIEDPADSRRRGSIKGLCKGQWGPSAAGRSEPPLKISRTEETMKDEIYKHAEPIVFFTINN